MKTNQIIKGNCIDSMKKIDEKSVELVLTDPPYNISGKSKLNLKNNTTEVRKRGHVLLKR